jgi:hypothetical protein
VLVLSAFARPPLIRPPLNGDADGDGLPNGMERALGTYMWVADSDGDGWDDWYEVYRGGDCADPTDSTDDDGDGVYQDTEDAYGCDDGLADTDGDGVDDWTEVYLGGDCADPAVGG